MRLAVLSDIHGNLPALQAVLDDLRTTPIDGYILAGDYYAGPHGSETRRILAGLPGWKIYGNGEVYLRRQRAGQQPPEWAVLKQFALYRWQIRNMHPEDWAFVEALPEQQVIRLPGMDPIRVVHGSHRSPFEGIFPSRLSADGASSAAMISSTSSLEQVWDHVSEPVFICGHTHMQWLVQRDGRQALNPGAVCGPLDGFIGAEYSLLESTGGHWRIELHHAAYDIGDIRRAFIDSSQMDEAHAFVRALIACLECGRDVTRDFLEHAYATAARMGFQNCRWVPDEAWDEAERTFEWPESVSAV